MGQFKHDPLPARHPIPNFNYYHVCYKIILHQFHMNCISRAMKNLCKGGLIMSSKSWWMCMKFVLNTKSKAKCMYSALCFVYICHNFASFLRNLQYPISLQLLYRQAALAEELALLKQVDQFSSNEQSLPTGKNGYSRYILYCYGIMSLKFFSHL